MLPGNTYHVYNHANGRENLFIEEKNYHFFLQKLSDYILPVCNLFAHCLMPNHFHLLIEVKQEEELQKAYQLHGPTVIFKQEELELKVSKSFANMFSSYTQSFNKVYHRKGSLFMPSMKTEIVETDESFCKVVHYLHANPVHHGFVKKLDQWMHSSYQILLSDSVTEIRRNEVMNIFGSREAFIKYHQQDIDIKTKWVDE
ncbi:MAG: transposase [Chitinophagaceae bacterium]|jgi:putative transposase|nr:transposase [Chitinophagaceae bacterium]